MALLGRQAAVPITSNPKGWHSAKHLGLSPSHGSVLCLLYYCSLGQLLAQDQQHQLLDMQIPAPYFIPT